MTPDQQNLLNDKLDEVEAMIRDLEIPMLKTTNDIDANNIIAATRMRLHLIDIELFSLYRLMENFHDSNRPKREPKSEPTIDDLLI
jgi:hypothetical protein